MWMLQSSVGVAAVAVAVIAEELRHLIRLRPHRNRQDRLKQPQKQRSRQNQAS